MLIQVRVLHESLVLIGLSPKPTRSPSSVSNLHDTDVRMDFETPILASWRADALSVLCLLLLPQPFSALLFSKCRCAPFRRVVPRLRSTPSALFNCCSCHLICDCKTSWFSAFASLRAPSKGLLCFIHFSDISVIPSCYYRYCAGPWRTWSLQCHAVLPHSFWQPQ